MSVTISENVQKFVFEGRDFTISFPSIKQEISIENKKSFYSEGSYFEIYKNQTPKAMELVLQINAVSTLEVLCPNMAKELKVDSLMDVDRKTSKLILDFYLDKIVPFIDKIEDSMNESLSDTEVEGDDSKK